MNSEEREIYTNGESLKKLQIDGAILHKHRLNDKKYEITLMVS